MSAYICLNFSVQDDNKGLSSDEFNKAIALFNDDNLLNDRLHNYIYYNGKVSKINDTIMETLSINTNIRIEQKIVDEQKSDRQSGGADEDDDLAAEKETLKSVLKDEAKVESDLLLLPANPINIIVDVLRPLMPDKYWEDYYNFRKTKILVNIVDNFVKDIKHNFLDVKQYWDISNIENKQTKKQRREEKKKIVEQIKNIITNYDEKGVDMYINIDKDAGTGKVVYNGTDYYVYYPEIVNTILEVDEDGDPVMETKKGITKQKETKIIEFVKNDNILTDGELFSVLLSPRDVIIDILSTRLGKNEPSVDKKAPALKQQEERIKNKEKQSLRCVSDKNGDLPLCCNEGCFRIPINEIYHGQEYPNFVSIRQECSSCTNMRKKFKPYTIYNGYRVHIILGKIVFIKCRPIVHKKNYCQNAGIEMRKDLFEKAFKNDANKNKLIEDFNKKLEIKRNKTATPLQEFAGKEQQCPLNLIPPIFNGDAPKGQEYLNGMSKIYVNLVSNCYDQDHISGGHADNRAQNIWTLCKICHSQKTLLGGDFGTKKDSSISDDKIKSINSNYEKFMIKNKIHVEAERKKNFLKSLIIDHDDFLEYIKDNEPKFFEELTDNMVIDYEDDNEDEDENGFHYYSYVGNDYSEKDTKLIKRLEIMLEKFEADRIEAERIEAERIEAEKIKEAVKKEAAKKEAARKKARKLQMQSKGKNN